MAKPKIVSSRAARPSVKTGGKQAAPVPTTPARNAACLFVEAPPEETAEETTARLCFSPAILNTITAMTFVKTGAGKGLSGGKALDVTACAEMMTRKVEGIQRGSTQEIEQALISQAVALQAIFSEMARRAANNMGEYLGPMEIYLRLAFKAQAQARATLETLAEIKNPRPVFARNVNVANGNQQVNNSEGQQHVNNVPAGPRAENSESPSNKLMEPE